MKVVLKQDVKDLGKKGELVNTSDGYARNYLFPRGLAVEANAAAMNDLKNKENAAKYKIKVETEKAEADKEIIDGKTLKFLGQPGNNGKLFGSVTTKDIAEKIKKDFGVDIDKKKITVDDIKTYGTFKANVKLNHGITAEVYVLVGE